MSSGIIHADGAMIAITFSKVLTDSRRVVRSSLREHNRSVITFAPKPVKDFLKAALGIESSFRIEVWLRETNFRPPFLKALFHRSINCVQFRGISELEVRKSGQRLERFAGIETNGGIGIAQGVNQKRIEPVATGSFLRRLPSHSPGQEGALAGIAFHQPLHRGGNRLVVFG